jgi:hypothetical protein
MSYQIQVQKYLNQTDFLTTTIYERNDLSNVIQPGEKFVVRQGDLVVTNYHIDNYRQRGLRRPWSQRKGNVYKYLGSHIVFPLQNETLLVHPEHGVVIIPRDYCELEFYTFSDAGD